MEADSKEQAEALVWNHEHIVVAETIAIAEAITLWRNLIVNKQITLSLCLFES
jgi:hypothetical protein